MMKEQAGAVGSLQGFGEIIQTNSHVPHVSTNNTHDYMHMLINSLFFRTYEKHHNHICGYGQTEKVSILLHQLDGHQIS